MYERIHPARLYEQIVEQIKRQVLRGELKVGDRLPPERELAEHFGVSRVAVREAMRVMREMGLVEVHPGRGTFIANGTSQAVRHSLSLMVRIAGQTASRQLVEVREMLEPPIAAMAAARAEREHLAAMEAAIATMDASMGDPDAFVEADLEFHLALAEATQNDILLILLDTIIGILREQRMRIFQVEGGPHRGQFHHRRILEAVARHDVEGARAAMEAHLRQVRDDSSQAPGAPT